VVGRTTTPKHAIKSQAKKPVSKSSFIRHRNDDYSNDLRKEKRKWDNYQLPPGESFTFMVCEQECLHTFEG
jgi:hypothetical protein